MMMMMMMMIMIIYFSCIFSIKILSLVETVYTHKTNWENILHIYLYDLCKNHLNTCRTRPKMCGCLVCFRSKVLFEAILNLLREVNLI